MTDYGPDVIADKLAKARREKARGRDLEPWSAPQSA